MDMQRNLQGKLGCPNIKMKTWVLAGTRGHVNPEPPKEACSGGGGPLAGLPPAPDAPGQGEQVQGPSGTPDAEHCWASADNTPATSH